MKRKLIVLLALVCLLTLGGCGHTRKTAPSSSAETVTAEQMEETFGMPVVRVMTDLPNSDMGARSNHLHITLESMPGFEKDFMIYEEQIPPSGADRENAVTRIKTEIMAGKGPDLFLCGQDTYGISGLSNAEGDPFFAFPEKAMKNRLFLPLDDYIAGAEYMEWDKFLPVVMEAGRNDEGQQIIPLGYFFEALAVEKEKYGLEGATYPATRDEMAESGNPAIRYASQCRSPSYVGRVMEPGADEPMLTEEELAEYMIRDCELSIKASDIDSVREDETSRGGSFMRTKFAWDGDPCPFGKDSPDYAIIPARNANGGVTANIAAFAAINRNARHPDQAFKIIDHLMSARVQQNSAFYKGRVYGIPVHMDLGSEEYPMDGGWYMKEANFKEFCAARDGITEARFLGPVDKAVWDIWITKFDSSEDVKAKVHSQYTLIRMLLAES